MIKLLIYVGAMWLAACTIYNDAAAQQLEYSAPTRRLLRTIEKAEAKAAKRADGHLLTSEQQKKYGVRITHEGEFIGALLEIDPPVNEDKLIELGVRINTRAGNIWTVDIPLRALPQLYTVSGLKMVEIAQPVSFFLNSARADTKVDQVHQGVQLPRGYAGKGVVVGVLDGGIDYRHPTFRDTTGKRLRMKKAWNQLKPGTAPSGFSYGIEHSDSAALMRAQRDVDSLSHGSHTSGIAAGSGYGSGIEYRGVAPEADIVTVTPDMFDHTKVLDAVQYVWRYAKSVGKPCTINMSFGTMLNTMDGTSLLDRGLEEFSKNNRGLALVVAAGNSGNTAAHLGHTFQRDTVRTMPFALLAPVPKIGVFGEVGKTFQVQVSLLDNRGTRIGSLPYFSTSARPQLDTFMRVGRDTFYVRIDGYSAYPTNSRPSIFLELENTNPFNFATAVVSVTAQEGMVHIYNAGMAQGAPLTDRLFGSNRALPGFTAGDTTHTVMSPGTSMGVITVGAHTTKNSYKDAGGRTRQIQANAPLGALAPFSSIGPTLDGRVKPDVTAPGNVVASSVSNFDPTVAANITVKNSQVGGQNAKYAVYEGTSMATPMVTGICALLLEANPNLNTESLREILRKTAVLDNFTGAIDKEKGVNNWGWGKVNVHAAMVYALNQVSVDNGPDAQNRSVLVFPNPANSQVSIHLQNYAQSKVEVQISTLMGQVVHTQSVLPQQSSHELQVGLQAFAPGTYLVSVKGLTQTHYSKLIIH